MPPPEERGAPEAGTPPCYEPGTPLIPAQHQPALVADYVGSFELDAGALPPAVSRFEPAGLYSPGRYLDLLRAAARALADPETAFALGRQALPGHFGAASHALLQAPTLRRALQVLVAHPARLSPLLVPHLHVSARAVVLYWTEAAPAPDLRGFLVDLQMTAVDAMCRWLAGQRLPWTFCFNRPRPARSELHEAHLGPRLRFGCHVDAMLIDPQWLDRPWSNPRALQSAAVHDALDRLAAADEPRRSFLALLYDHLERRLPWGPSLEPTAAAFGMSAATLKRRLALHGTHFQAELDRVRLHRALELMFCQGLSDPAIGRSLGIADPTNYRRALRRWSGVTPRLLRDALQPLSLC